MARLSRPRVCRPGDRVLIASPLSPAKLPRLFGRHVCRVGGGAGGGAFAGDFGCQPRRERPAQKRFGPSKNQRSNGCANFPRLLCLHGDLTGGKPQPMKAVARKDSDLAALMATSGSTGVPRFVMVTHGNLRANTEAIARSQGLAGRRTGDAGAADQLLLWRERVAYASLAWAAAWCSTGGSCFRTKWCRRWPCNTTALRFAGVPTAYNVLVERSKIRDNPTSRACGGCCRRAERWRRPVIEEIRRAVPRRSILCDVRPDRSHRADLLPRSGAP